MAFTQGGGRDGWPFKVAVCEMVQSHPVGLHSRKNARYMRTTKLCRAEGSRISVGKPLLPAGQRWSLVGSGALVGRGGAGQRLRIESAGFADLEKKR